jgi:hypothetical protein
VSEQPPTEYAPPGWFPDPTGLPAQRWWDGAQWGEQTRSTPRDQREEPLPFQPQQDAGQPRLVGRSWLRRDNVKVPAVLGSLAALVIVIGGIVSTTGNAKQADDASAIAIAAPTGSTTPNRASTNHATGAETRQRKAWATPHTTTPAPAATNPAPAPTVTAASGSSHYPCELRPAACNGDVSAPKYLARPSPATYSRRDTTSNLSPTDHRDHAIHWRKHQTGDHLPDAYLVPTQRPPTPPPTSLTPPPTTALTSPPTTAPTSPPTAAPTPPAPSTTPTTPPPTTAASPPPSSAPAPGSSPADPINLGSIYYVGSGGVCGESRTPGVLGDNGTGSAIWYEFTTGNAACGGMAMQAVSFIVNQGTGGAGRYGAATSAAAVSPDVPLGIADVISDPQPDTVYYLEVTGSGQFTVTLWS